MRTAKHTIHKITEKVYGNIKEFLKKINKIRLDNIISSLERNSNQMLKWANMDEVPLKFDPTFHRTYAKTGDKEVSIKTISNYKKSLTMCLTVTSDGQFFPVLIIFKGNSKLFVNKIEIFNEHIFFTQNKKGWMNHFLLSQWMKKIYC